jgi:hypothetical protein
MRIPPEPKPDNNVGNLWIPFYQRVRTLFEAMRRRGFDPVIFEGKRSQERQDWLYNYSRLFAIGKKPKTWTRTASKHLVGKAVDVVSKKSLWANPAFYQALQEEVNKISGIRTLAPLESCHVEWTGEQ